jgi:hypothetical protein
MAKTSIIHPYIEWAKNRLNEIDATVSTLEETVNDLGEETRAKAEKALEGMREQQGIFKTQIEEHLESTEKNWESSVSQLTDEWRIFETYVIAYADAAKDQGEQYEAAFKARAKAQLEAWQAAVDNVRRASSDFQAERKKEIMHALDKMSDEAKATKKKLDRIESAGNQTWRALSKALSESRIAFEKANKEAHEAFKSASD